MKKRCILGWLGVLSVLLLPVCALANGFAINEQGAKAIGMAGAFVAQADDPTAVYYNPAGMVQLERTQFSAGVSPIIPNGKFQSSTNDPIFRGTTPGETTDIEDNAFFIPNAYFTHKLSDQFSVGFGSFANFGLKTEWPSGWEGRFIPGGIKAEVTTFSLNPSVAFKPHDRLSIGFGAVYQYFDFTLEQKQFVGFNPATMQTIELDSKFRGDDWAWGWNAGVLFWITDNLKFGASYRSEISHSQTYGKLSFNPNVPGVPDTGFRINVTTPAIAYLGLAYNWRAFTFEFDAQWTEWSSWKQISAAFDSPVGGQPSLTVKEDWNDAWAYRFGVQYAVNQYFDVRGGVIYDESPIPSRSVSPRLPSGDRWLYCIGFGGHYGSLDVDFAYNYLDDESRKLGSTAGEDDIAENTPVGPLEGKFKDVDAHIFSLNLTYKF